MATITYTCEGCGVEFTKKVGDEGRGRFHSIKCARAHQVMASREDRFWAKVDRRGPDECWPWIGAHAQYGHGTLRTGPRGATRQEFAHRISYELNVGPIPDGLDTLHSCDNPPCVNPRHLRPGTQADNNLDRDIRGRANTLRGEQVGTSRMTVDQVRAIRQRRADGALLREIAAEFGLTIGGVDGIVKRRNWRHVE